MTEPPAPVQFASPAEAMRHAIEMARQGIGHVEPNPPVGAVVLDVTGRLVGAGWHQKHGGPHAEVHALREAGDRARDGTLCVTLEPCCHHGKTPPCTDAVIASRVRRVFVAVRDPAPWVDGNGIEQLRSAGIEVVIGLEEEEARELVKPFTKVVTQGLPWVHAKWAMTLDGKIATRSGDSQWITNEASRAIVHELRGRMDAIIIGIETALHDDPLLTARPPGPRMAMRVVLDSQARLPLESQLVRTAREVPLLVCASDSAPVEIRRALEAAGVEVLVLKETTTSSASASVLSLQRVLEECGRRKFTHVLIEGGSKVLGSAFDQQLIDEVHAFIAPAVVGGADAFTPVAGVGRERIELRHSLRQPAIREIDGDVYIHGRVRR